MLSFAHAPAARTGKLHSHVPARLLPYVDELEALVRSPHHADLSPHLDGEAGRRLRKLVPIEKLRTLGAFFTGEDIAAQLLRRVPQRRRRYIDPACGCGDLLLAASARLPVDPSLEATLREWNHRLVGRDLVPEFVRAARARLAIAAFSRGARPTGAAAQPAALLTNVAVGDGLELRHGCGDAVLLNPPYGRVVAPAGCRWASGSTTAAAIFLDAILEACEPGVQIAGVLPEVLRAGSRYDRFRADVERRAAVEAVEPLGVFDALTDVHVFVFAGRTRPRRGRGTGDWVGALAGERLGDICDVSVGAVVPHRDPHSGPWRLYLDARSRGSLPDVQPGRKRRFAKRVFDPPFVVLPRTSRPEERERMGLRSTVVLADRAVAVENHLLVLMPHDRTLVACREVAALVESSAAAQFLNERLRCRHLTVRAVRDIPR